MYQKPDPEFLEQGDLFRYPLPLSLCSPVHEIVRNRHGRGQVEIYDFLDLDLGGGQPYGENKREFESVVATARYTEWFIVGTQSCDLDDGDLGKGKKRIPVESAFVLRVLPIVELFTRERVLQVETTDGETALLTHDEFLWRFARDNCEAAQLDAMDPVTYGDRVRHVVQSWEPKDKKLREHRNKIDSRFQGWIDSPRRHHLHADAEHGIPESFVELLSPFAILHHSLKELAFPSTGAPSARQATLTPKEKLVFAQAIAGRIQRAAIDDEDQPQPLITKKK